MEDGVFGERPLVRRCHAEAARQKERTNGKDTHAMQRTRADHKRDSRSVFIAIGADRSRQEADTKKPTECAWKADGD